MDFCIRHQKFLGYSIVSLLTAASEYIFSSVVFKCPCNSWNTLYGCSFIIAPAFVLFLLGYMTNARVWLLVTGRCSPKNQCSCDSCGHFHKVLVPVTASALVAPFTWIAVALLSASFYACAASGNSFIRKLVCKDIKEYCNASLEKIPCDEELSKKIGAFHSLQAQSQVKPLCYALPWWTPVLVKASLLCSSLMDLSPTLFTHTGACRGLQEPLSLTLCE